MRNFFFRPASNNGQPGAADQTTRWSCPRLKRFLKNDAQTLHRPVFKECRTKSTSRIVDLGPFPILTFAFCIVARIVPRLWTSLELTNIHILCNSTFLHFKYCFVRMAARLKEINTSLIFFPVYLFIFHLDKQFLDSSMDPSANVTCNITILGYTWFCSIFTKRMIPCASFTVVIPWQPFTRIAAQLRNLNIQGADF